MAEIREHFGLSSLKHDAEWLCIRALLRDFMCMAALDFDIPWKQQDMVRLGNLITFIRERIPRFCRFANNWAAELVVQDIFNHKRTHLLKLERENKTPDTRRAPKNRKGKCNCDLQLNSFSNIYILGASKEATSKKTLQHNGASKSRQRPLSSSNNGSLPGSPSTPDRGRASPTGWPGSRAGSRASSHTSSCDGSRDSSPAGSRAGPRAHSNASPAEHSPPPSSTRQPNESPLQGGAGSNREHGGCNEAEDAPIPGSRQNDAKRNTHEEDEEAPVAPCRTGLRARAGLAAASLLAANGAAEDDDTARKSSGGGKKGGKAKAKPKPKKGKGEGEELFPDEGEEDGDE
ncbi:hypothetical protein BDV93DRAFT_238362 [Ceratobasidium sp. AG-I]|nr:hypothetical protein BDV93DRAFT_238362 [Ceratobasidium sp. AG-I]